MENCNIKNTFAEFQNISAEDTRKRFFMPPAKIVKTFGNVKNSEQLLTRAASQAMITCGDNIPCIMQNQKGGTRAAILLDYGREIHGCVRVAAYTVHKNNSDIDIPFKAHIRFGESISEAITPLGEKNARNDHAIRDTLSDFSFMSANDTGETGFRFLYFEIEDDDITVNLASLAAVLIINDYPYLGSFESSDSLLNEIWKTAAYTVQLNTQQYFWDGIKRDRIVWFGDMNTEICTAYAVFGDIPQIKASLDFGVESTPLPNWMNGIPSYSFWWLLNLKELYMHTGNAEYVNKHAEYITGLTKQILDIISEQGTIINSKIPRGEFIDWSTEGKQQEKHVGFVGLLAATLIALPTLLEVINRQDLISQCNEKYQAVKANAPKPVNQKIATSLLILGGLAPASETDKNFISPGGASGYSTFMGYSILNAKAVAGNYDGAIQAIKEYWGAMLKMGATTFWEDFDLEWLPNASRIDEFPNESQKDIHGDFGKFCYEKLRHSLCHGWASGPCPWLTENVLGIHILEPGMKKLLIKPRLSNLEYVKGSVPTPYGVVTVHHTKNADGTVTTQYTAPAQVAIQVQN